MLPVNPCAQNASPPPTPRPLCVPPPPHRCIPHVAFLACRAPRLIACCLGRQRIMCVCVCLCEHRLTPPSAFSGRPQEDTVRHQRGVPGAVLPSREHVTLPLSLRLWLLLQLVPQACRQACCPLVTRTPTHRVPASGPPAQATERGDLDEAEIKKKAGNV